MATKVSHTQKYWFAIGYHQCVTNQYDPPSQEFIDYFKEMLGIDIYQEYLDGKKSAEKDLKNGIY